MINTSIIEVRLGKDPELRYTAEGTAVVNMSGASNYKYNSHERTDWFPFVAWGKLAEIAAQYLHKGSHVTFIGRLQTRTWEGEDGIKHYVTEIRVGEMSFLDPKNGSEQKEYKDNVGPQANEETTVLEDDIPF